MTPTIPLPTPAFDWALILWIAVAVTTVLLWGRFWDGEE